jgi:hypothetical protein
MTRHEINNDNETTRATPRGRYFLRGGLTLLAVALAARWAGAPPVLFWPMFGVAILLKALFLLTLTRAKGFRPGAGHWLVVAGVAVILLSLLFKTVFPLPALHGVLLVAAIALKVTGLIVILSRGPAQRSRELPGAK